jgi:hypothetical protein
MLGVAIDWNSIAPEVRQGQVVPVVAMGMGQKHGPDPIPAQADRSHSPAELPRPQPDVDEHPKSARLDEAGIS